MPLMMPLLHRPAFKDTHALRGSTTDDLPSHQSRSNHSALSVYTHDLMSVARRGSVITSLSSYSYRIGARLARRVFKIGTLVMEWCTVGWMCACERASDPPPRLRPRDASRASGARLHNPFVRSAGDTRVGCVASSCDDDRRANTYRQLFFYNILKLIRVQRSLSGFGTSYKNSSSINLIKQLTKINDFERQIF